MRSSGNTRGYFDHSHSSHAIIDIPDSERTYANTLLALEDRGGVVFRYVAPDGEKDPSANPNVGSTSEWRKMEREVK